MTRCTAGHFITQTQGLTPSVAPGLIVEEIHSIKEEQKAAAAADRRRENEKALSPRHTNQPPLLPEPNMTDMPVADDNDVHPVGSVEEELEFLKELQI
ncbi:hypothetical protein HDU85_002984 [Gaertneriomyces sp. JEL0708]|nr:hypothetical protein HDU85_002984 [Gaertneriomyces sp. JEL0708]